MKNIVFMMRGTYEIEVAHALFLMKSIFYLDWSFNLISLQMFLIFNLILNYDIYRMMKNPFKPPRMRVYNYYAKAATICFLLLGA